MIDRLVGTLVEKYPVSAIIDCTGIGFELRIPLSTYEELPLPGSHCTLYSHLHVSQEDIRLYGFATKPERELFLMLIGVSGIGPKIALSVLSTLTIPAFIKAIQRAEDFTIAKVPGLGKKSAMRLILELKDDVSKLIDQLDKSDYIVSDHRVLEVESALESLGFNIKEIRKELGLMPTDIFDLPTEQIIKEAIKRIYQKRK